MKPKYTNIKIRLGDLVAWSGNPKFSTKAQALRLIESEKEFGQPQPFTVSPYLEDGKRCDVYDGMQRLAAWNTVYGADFIVDARQSDRHFTDEERRKFALIMHTATGSLDWNALSAWDTESVRDWVGGEEKLKEWNNDANNLKEMLRAEGDDSNEYSKKIEAPIYTPKGDKPHITDLFDNSKTLTLIAEIDNSELPEDEKTFLRIAAQRHTVINFKRVAEYYAHSEKPAQLLFENNALVIIDFNKAIELGYVKLSHEIAKQYGIDYGK